MGRKSNLDRLMYFDSKSYLKDLKVEMEKVAEGIRDELYRKMKSNFSGLVLKKNKVKMANGKVTSDYDRLNAVLDSIITEKISYSKKCVLETAVKAISKHFKDSFIGLYYEYGTGIYAEDVPYLKNLGDPNPFRKGKEIVSRSRNYKRGLWHDAGGNLRITGSVRGGGSGNKFRQYIGEDIVPQHWFKKAVDEMQNKLIERLLDVVNEINPINYLYLKDKFVLGRD